MKRVAISMIVTLIVGFPNLHATFAQEGRTQNLHQAIINGDIEHVKSLLSGGADINEKNRLGGTPLHTAISKKNEEIAQLLISKGPDLNAKDKQGRTPLYLAVENGMKSLVELLVSKGVDINAMTIRGQNALTVSRSTGNTELTEFLLKHGAQEPVLQDMEGDGYYGRRPGMPGEGLGAASGRQGRTRGRARAAAPTAPQVDLLADPNEIRTRVKTFDGLEKAIKEVADKSAGEERQWLQTRYDNRSLLARAVQSQFDVEMGLVRKTAVAEKAKKTVAAIDELLSVKKERGKKLSRELLQLRREQQLTESGRGRGRTSGRGTRGRSAQGGLYGGADTTDSLYDYGGAAGGMNRSQRPTRPAEQVDPQTEDEIRRWTQASPDKKGDLAKTVHEQILAEIGSVRVVAVEEEAKKTTAAIDGLLLARQERYGQLVLKMEEAERVAQARQLQDPRGRGRGTGGQLQGDSTQQQNMQRGRGRRR